MTFVYLHVIWIACWIGFGVEDYPYGLLTMIVSLEAIFLSTFVMISQNRADAKRQVIADQQWKTVKEEDAQNQEQLDLTKKILEVVFAEGPSGHGCRTADVTDQHRRSDSAEGDRGACDEHREDRA
jgi:uncharacterized membrane protein